MGNFRDWRFRAVLDIVYSTIGIHIPEEHFPTIRRFMEDRRETLKISGEKYLKTLQTDPSELEKLINNAMINETYFFREEKQFQLIKDSIFSELNGENPLRFWSATCATGEEAISLALAAHEYFTENLWKQITIFATDVNSEDLDKFGQGHYTKHSFKTDGESFRYLFDFDNKGNYLLPDIYKSRIKISQLNLYNDDAFNFPNHLDFIFFRNTIIYYDSELKTSLLNKVISRLKPGGYLFVSISEVPFVPLNNLELMEQNNIYYFRKKRE